MGARKGGVVRRAPARRHRQPTQGPPLCSRDGTSRARAGAIRPRHHRHSGRPRELTPGDYGRDHEFAGAGGRIRGAGERSGDLGGSVPFARNRRGGDGPEHSRRRGSSGARTGKPLDDVMDEKATNSLASHARSLAERRGRPAAVAESMVRESKSFTEKEARAVGVVEILAPIEPSSCASSTGESSTFAAGLRLPDAGPHAHRDADVAHSIGCWTRSRTRPSPRCS